MPDNTTQKTPAFVADNTAIEYVLRASLACENTTLAVGQRFFLCQTIADAQDMPEAVEVVEVTDTTFTIEFDIGERIVFLRAGFPRVVAADTGYEFEFYDVCDDVVAVCVLLRKRDVLTLARMKLAQAADPGYEYVPSNDLAMLLIDVRVAENKLKEQYAAVATLAEK